MGFRVGVDVGGSFTDFAVIEESSAKIATLKVFSRPDAPGAEIMEGLRQIKERYGIDAEDITYFTHGTTVGINTVIQRNGLKLALFTTRNFEDVLEMARLKIVTFHNLMSLRPAPLITRDCVFGIEERLDAQGNVLVAVDVASVEAAVANARAVGAQGIVVSFLHSYRNPAHEKQVREIVERLAPEIPCFCSAEIWPIIREFERTITATISGYVQPTVARYLDRFADTLKAAGISAPLRITKSNGGVMGVAQARSECVQMILSGTASGVIGAAYVARASDLPHILSLDIGGTSADVAIITDGVPQYGVGETIGEFQIHIPTVSITSIGHGGGSIASVDDLGVLKVGPESAGSTPGPAGYGRGGTRPTLTDAMAVCGWLGNGSLGYNAITLDREKSRTAFSPLAARLGTSVEVVAQSVVDLSVSGMYADTSALMSRFGIEPRSYRIMAFGGAGPMMACFLARELNLQGVVVPLSPGVLSALGGLIADLANDFVSTLYVTVDDGGGREISAAYEDLLVRARHWLEVDQGYTGPYSVTCTCDMRYRGQSFETSTIVEPGALEAGDIAAIREAFHGEHARLFGHSEAASIVQLVSLRLTVSAATPKPVLPLIEAARAPLTPSGSARCWVDQDWQEVALYERSAMRAGHAFTGPAIVLQDDTTTVVPERFSALVDKAGNLLLTPVSSEDRS